MKKIFLLFLILPFLVFFASATKPVEAAPSFATAQDVSFEKYVNTDGFNSISAQGDDSAFSFSCRTNCNHHKGGDNNPPANTSSSSASKLFENVVGKIGSHILVILTSVSLNTRVILLLFTAVIASWLLHPRWYLRLSTGVSPPPIG